MEQQERTVLRGMTLGELQDVALQLQLPRFTATQMAQWLYVKGVSSIDEMTNLSKEARRKLAEHYQVGAMPPVKSQKSVDGTEKFLFPVRTLRHSPAPNSLPFVETVYIPDADRATLCVSSQVGCKMGCRFCQTGRQGWQGDLTAADILNQIYSLPYRETLTNIVFMGQGEPMDNLQSLLRATELLTAPYGLAWSPRRITVSTVGIPQKVKTFLDNSQCHIAVSMHSPFPEQRAELMPAEKAQSISDTVALLRQYDFAHQRRCSFEYICFGGLNDTLRHAEGIVKLLRGLPARVNLIRFHAIPDSPLPATDEAQMERLRDYLTAHGVFTTIRASRGEDILAACGLLSTKSSNSEYEHHYI